MNNQVTVILDEKEAEEFKLFQKHYDLFAKIDEHKIFDIQFGKCILNIAFGELQNVVREEVVWKR